MLEAGFPKIVGSVLISMVTADMRHTRLAVSLVSMYDERYLNDIVLPQIGASQTQLATPSRLLGGLLPRRREVHQSPPTVVRSRAWIEKPDRWRYEEPDDSGAVALAHGSDGVTRWAYVDGSIRQWKPTPETGARQLPPTAWQQAPNQPLREIIDPSLVLPALAIESAEERETAFGRAVRLSGHPRSADIVESALVSPWAEQCVIDVHCLTGIVVAACNFGTNGQCLTQHSLETLQTSIEITSETFAVPTRDSFS
ncbi:hypothetical protein O7632_05520 [Solwaraspora sp. WMMD406]|uniref:hypothetical protein n=1 Tax=Solwaraspora sp. WMMD406 TaxID=3016095 RepID=UPI0024178B28|nr:hypothetical protein [Solwaraspora sp. WMMD406]MDG4763571.1 hypothetical protein [Solwaraspora sp. WMMD406]